jgi:hypothetical protein
MEDPMEATRGRADFSFPRLALQRREAAASLNVGVDTFDRHIRPHLKVVYVGDLRLWPTAELQRWLDDNTRTVG